MTIRRLVVDGTVVPDVHIASKDIGFPTLRQIKVSVPGADGDLDLTTALTDGVPRFANRTVSFTCVLLPTATSPSLWDVQRRIGAAWHGQEITLTTDDEPDSYWHGRAVVDGWTEIEGEIGWTLTLDAFPFRTSTSGSTQSGNATAAGTPITLHVGQMPTPPVVTGAVGTVVTDARGQWWALDGTAHTYPGLVIGPGDTELTLTSQSGDVVVFDWVDGWF